jgi:hypothetical protein
MLAMCSIHFISDVIDTPRYLADGHEEDSNLSPGYEKPISQHLIGYRNHRTTAVNIIRRKKETSQTNPTIQNIKWISKN